jgi:hypothetical protein
MEARAVCVLFLLISSKFNTLCFLAIVAKRKLSAMGAGVYWIKNSLFFFPLADDIMVYIIRWRQSSLVGCDM